ncbi:MAG: hypothetical protein ABI824_05600 [Acidobacteriota bacterium]
MAESQIPGIRVSGPQTPEFAKYISDLSGGTKINDPETSASVANLLTRAIVVTNTGNRAIKLFVVRWEFTNARGGRQAEGQWQEFPDNTHFDPGASRLITTNPNLSAALRSPQVDSALAQTGAVKGRAMFQSSSIRVSVDAVLFADGGFNGPDASGIFNELTAEQKFVRGFRAELESLGPDMEKIETRLREMLSQKPEPGELRTIHRRMDMAVKLLGATRLGEPHFRSVLEADYGDAERPTLRREN